MSHSICKTNGKITYEDALNSADSANDLRLMIKLDSEHDFMEDADKGGLSIQEDEEEKSRGGLSFR